MPQMGPVAFSLTGSANTNVELPPIDLSRCRFIRLSLHLTGVGTGTGADTLNVYFQEAGDDATPTWDDRAAFPQLTGAMTVSAAAPERRIIEWPCYTNPATLADASREPSGSVGASHIAAGTYIPGPLKGKRRTSAGALSRYRLRYEVVDADSSATFTGNFFLDFGPGV